MNGVAAKIAEEVAVFFEHNDIDAGARQQISRHYAGGTSAHDANTGPNAGIDGLRRWRPLFHEFHDSTVPWIQAEMTLLRKRRAATTSRNVPIARSARPSVHRCRIVAPRKITPRVMLMKYVAGIK